MSLFFIYSAHNGMNYFLLKLKENTNQLCSNYTSLLFKHYLLRISQYNTTRTGVFNTDGSTGQITQSHTEYDKAVLKLRDVVGFGVSTESESWPSTARTVIVTPGEIRRPEPVPSPGEWT